MKWGDMNEDIQIDLKEISNHISVLCNIIIFSVIFLDSVFILLYDPYSA